MSTNRPLTHLSGLVSIVSLDVTKENLYADNCILPAGVLVKKSDNVIYLSDGVHSIRNLVPIIDKLLTSPEKVALNNAFSTGVYTVRSGGVVVHNRNGKIDDSSLGIVESGKIKESYLSDFVESGILKYAKLPDSVKNSFIIVDSYTDLPNVSVENRKKLVLVRDASSDPNTNITGNNLYYYDTDRWQSLLTVASSDVTYESVQAASGIMYDHPLHLCTGESDIHTVLDALVIGEVETPPDEPDEPDEPDNPPEQSTHDETASSIEQDYATIINAIEAAEGADSPDLYIEQNKPYSYMLIVDGSIFDNPEQITVTVTDTTSNTTGTLQLNMVADDNPNVFVGGYESDGSDGMYDVIDDNTSNRDHNVTVMITDGTKTAILSGTMINCISGPSVSLAGVYKSYRSIKFVPGYTATGIQRWSITS